MSSGAVRISTGAMTSAEVLISDGAITSAAVLISDGAMTSAVVLISAGAITSAWVRNDAGAMTRGGVRRLYCTFDAGVGLGDGVLCTGGRPAVGGRDVVDVDARATADGVAVRPTIATSARRFIARSGASHLGSA